MSGSTFQQVGLSLQLIAKLAVLWIALLVLPFAGNAVTRIMRHGRSMRRIALGRTQELQTDLLAAGIPL